MVVITEAEYNASGGPELSKHRPPILRSRTSRIRITRESRTLTELNPETTYAVFIRAVDEEDNRGSWSPVAFGSTAPVAPNPPTALSCSAAENSDLPALECEVTEPGDEGELGTEPVSALEVFISTDELDEDSLHVLVPTDVNFIPAVRLAGQVTEFSLSGLTQNTTYSIALRAIDEFGLPSLAVFTVATTLDLTPPGPVTNLDIVNAVDAPRSIAELVVPHRSSQKAGLLTLRPTRTSTRAGFQRPVSFKPKSG